MQAKTANFKGTFSPAGAIEDKLPSTVSRKTFFFRAFTESKLFLATKRVVGAALFVMSLDFAVESFYNKVFSQEADKKSNEMVLNRNNPPNVQGGFWYISQQWVKTFSMPVSIVNGDTTFVGEDSSAVSKYFHSDLYEDAYHNDANGRISSTISNVNLSNSQIKSYEVNYFTFKGQPNSPELVHSQNMPDSVARHLLDTAFLHPDLLEPLQEEPDVPKVAWVATVAGKNAEGEIVKRIVYVNPNYLSDVIYPPNFWRTSATFYLPLTDSTGLRMGWGNFRVIINGQGKQELEPFQGGEGYRVQFSWLTGIPQEPVNQPESMALNQNYPNPFNPTTTIPYTIAYGNGNAHISMDVYDAAGKKISTLVDESKASGSYTVQFDGSKLSSGVYFYTLSLDGTQIDTKKMVLLK